MSESQSIYWTNTTAKLGDLLPWTDNPKTSTKRDARALLKSWDELGQFQTIAIGPGGEVYDGHQRLSALLTVHGADYEIVARQSSRPLDETERRKIALYSRQIGQWDWDKLSAWEPAELMEWGGMDAETLKDWKRDTAALTNFLYSEGEETQDDPMKEWEGMPEFENGDARAVRTIHCHFRNEKDVDDFCLLLGIKIDKSTSTLWFPNKPPTNKELFISDES